MNQRTKDLIEALEWASSVLGMPGESPYICDCLREWFRKNKPSSYKYCADMIRDFGKLKPVNDKWTQGKYWIGELGWWSFPYLHGHVFFDSSQFNEVIKIKREFIKEKIQELKAE